MKKILFISLLLITGFFNACDSGLTPKEQLFVGNWRMQKYESNENIPESERQNYEQGINNLKSRFRLLLLEDKTFMRDGFAQKTETGTWFINTEGTLLNLQSENQAGTIFVEKITDKIMVLSVEEGKVRVKMTLVKVGE